VPVLHAAWVIPAARDFRSVVWRGNINLPFHCAGDAKRPLVQKSTAAAGGVRWRAMMDARPTRSDRDAGKQCGLHGPLNNGSDERPLNVGISTTTAATANASCPTHMPMLLLLLLLLLMASLQL